MLIVDGQIHLPGARRPHMIGRSPIWPSRRLPAWTPSVLTALGPGLAKPEAASASAVVRHFTAAKAAKTRDAAK
jgi:hypothetical protein